MSFSSQLKRTKLQLDQRTASIKTVLERPMELPAVDDRRMGRKHDHVYGYTADFDAPGIGICKVRSFCQWVMAAMMYLPVKGLQRLQCFWGLLICHLWNVCH